MKKRKYTILWRGSFLYMTLCSLYSCACLPKEEMAVCMKDPSFLQIVAEDETTVAFEPMWPKNDWWQYFDDTQLNQLIQLCLQSNPQIELAKARWQKVKSFAQAARSPLFPSLDFSITNDSIVQSKRGDLLSYTNLLPVTYNLSDITLDFQWELDLFGKNRHQFESLLGQAAAEEIEIQQMRLVLAAQVASTYFHWQGTQNTLSCLQAILEAYERIRILMEERLHMGLDNAISLLDIETKKAHVAEQIELAKEESDKVRHTLALLVATGPETDLDLQRHTFDSGSPYPLPDNIPLQLVSRRPDLTAELYRMQSAASRVKVAKSGFYPNINISGFAGFESISLSNIFSMPSKVASLEPALTLPIFTAGKLQADLCAAFAEYEQAVASYNQKILQAAKEVADSITGLKATQKQLTYRLQQVEWTIKKAELGKARVCAGLNSRILLEQDIIEYLQQIIAFTQDKVKQKLYAVALNAALGGGFDNSEGKDEQPPD